MSDKKVSQETINEAAQAPKMNYRDLLVATGIIREEDKQYLGGGGVYQEIGSIMISNGDYSYSHVLYRDDSDFFTKISFQAKGTIFEEGLQYMARAMNTELEDEESIMFPASSWEVSATGEYKVSLLYSKDGGEVNIDGRKIVVKPGTFRIRVKAQGMKISDRQREGILNDLIKVYRKDRTGENVAAALAS